MREVKDRYESFLMSRENVVGVAIGERFENGGPTGEQVITVLVTEKKPEYTLEEEQIIPRELDGVRTDVVEVGEIQAPPPPVTIEDVWVDRMRPARPGCSIGHYQITAGTFGAVVKNSASHYILSNNHVLARSNAGKAGDPIWQPGRHDGGSPSDRIAELTEFVPISIVDTGVTCAVAKAVASVCNAAAQILGSRHRMRPIQVTSQPNYVDAAIARPISDGLVSPNILGGIGMPTGLSAATVGMDVQKSGRTTGHTEGRVAQIAATVRVSYGFGRYATFREQIVAVAHGEGAMSAGGDSGSLVLDMERHAVGLLFAGSKTTTIISPIDLVLSLLQVDLVT